MKPVWLYRVDPRGLTVVGRRTVLALDVVSEAKVAPGPTSDRISAIALREPRYGATNRGDAAARDSPFTADPNCRHSLREVHPAFALIPPARDQISLVLSLSPSLSMASPGVTDVIGQDEQGVRSVGSQNCQGCICVVPGRKHHRFDSRQTDVLISA